MAIVSYNACYIVFISRSDISQKATDAKFSAKKKNSPNLQLLVRAVLQFTCVLLLVFFFLLFFICLVSISTLSVLSFSVLFCLVMFFYRIWGISVALKSLGAMSGMFWFNTSLPELSFDKSVKICGFWGQHIGEHRKMEQGWYEDGEAWDHSWGWEGRTLGCLLQVQRDDRYSYEIFQIPELSTWPKRLAVSSRQADNHLALWCQLLPALLWTAGWR